MNRRLNGRHESLVPHKEEEEDITGRQNGKFAESDVDGIQVEEVAKNEGQFRPDNESVEDHWPNGRDEHSRRQVGNEDAAQERRQGSEDPVRPADRGGEIG